MKVIYADTNKYDGEYRLILTCQGTKRDLAKFGITLTEGLTLTFYMDDADDEGNRDDLIFEGTVHFDQIKRHWVAEVDWDQIKNLSKLSKGLGSDLQYCNECNE
ncbi:MAG: hypothetical protein WBD16_00215 [Pyrinomonadaceae bacterium]